MFLKIYIISKNPQIGIFYNICNINLLFIKDINFYIIEKLKMKHIYTHIKIFIILIKIYYFTKKNLTRKS